MRDVETVQAGCMEASCRCSWQAESEAPVIWSLTVHQPLAGPPIPHPPPRTGLLMLVFSPGFCLANAVIRSYIMLPPPGSAYIGNCPTSSFKCSCIFKKVQVFVRYTHVWKTPRTSLMVFYLKVNQAEVEQFNAISRRGTMQDVQEKEFNINLNRTC